MSSSTSSSRRFFAGIALPLLAALILCAASTAFLMASGEYDDLYEITDKQERTGGYYGSALFQRVFHYKKHLFLEKKPEAVAIGSSRVLQFRQADFSVPFVNLGSMSSLDETIEIVNDLLPFHKPALVIVGIDFWWFHPAFENRHVNRSPEDVTPSVRDILSPLSWLVRGKITPAQIIDIAQGQTPHIGITAQTRGDGYSIDGAYHYTSTLTGSAPAGDPQFSDTLKKIKSGSSIYVQGNDISDIQWRKLSLLLQKIKDAGISPILFLPPVAPAVQQAMDETGKYRYIATLRQKLADKAETEGFAFFDDHNATAVGGSDCEFIDGHHGGPVLYNRILLDMAITQDTARERLPLAQIGWNIQKFSGRAAMGEHETDFLGIGCNKERNTP